MTGRPMHERLVATINEERERLASRRGFLTGTAKLAGGGALALSMTGIPGFASRAEAQAELEDDVDVLNYALTLEHLEFAFYRDGLEALGEDSFGVGPFDDSIFERLTEIRDHEETHVETLTSVIEDLDGEPVEEAEYVFDFTDAAVFLATAQVLENTGVSAYDGAAQFISDPALLTAAGTIVAVEARHAAYLNLVNGTLPFPDSFENPLTPEEVLLAAGPFFATDGDDEGTPDA
ncbi:MAG: ferritin-like domain-containing protein [Chloroflexia bacterium]|nr:ferritin-like domain-containing protein [Chloroflexia bacterium]MDQ3514018.1 ferritin-like domain-containing protein [Chloroflexota bacterium]